MCTVYYIETDIVFLTDNAGPGFSCPCSGRACVGAESESVKHLVGEWSESGQSQETLLKKLYRHTDRTRPAAECGGDSEGYVTSSLQSQ